jgi:putative DNA primase/helicase
MQPQQRLRTANKTARHQHLFCFYRCHHAKPGRSMLTVHRYAAKSSLRRKDILDNYSALLVRGAGGKGANGKTTLLKVLTTILGDYHQSTPIETFTESKQDRHPTELADLHSARMVTSVETEEGRRWAESRIKQLTGGDEVKARFMRQDFFKYTPQFKLVIAGNHKPGLRSVDEAIRRPVNLVPFAVTIPPEERDRRLNEKLEPELPGIFAWMIRGCMAWRERGLDPPESVTAATQTYLAEEDAVAAWMDERCDFDPQGWTKISDLFRSWTEWATAAGEYVGGMKRFSQVLDNRPQLSKVRDRVEGRGFQGVRLRP